MNTARPTIVVTKILTLLALGLTAEAQLTACKGGTAYLDTGAAEDSEDSGEPEGCTALVWRDRGSLGAEADGGYGDVAVSDQHVIVIDRDGAGYAVLRNELVGAEYGLDYKVAADVTIGAPLERVQVADHLLLLGSKGEAGGMPGSIDGQVLAIDTDDLSGPLADGGQIANPDELSRLPYWGVRGSVPRPGARTADVEADVTGDGVLDVVVRAGGALLIFDGAALAQMPADPARSALDEGMAWGILEVCAQAVPVDTAVFGTGAAGQGVLAVSCPADSETASVGSLYLYELPLAPPDVTSGDSPPPNDITDENNEGSFGLTSSGGGNLATLGLGEALFVASPALGRVLELNATGAAIDTLTQRYVFSPEVPGTTEPVGRFGAAVALVRDASGCASLVVSDPAYPLAEGNGYGSVYAVPVETATATSAMWSAWRAPYDALMTDPRHALGSTLAVSPDGSFVAVGAAIGKGGWRTDLQVLSVE